MIVALIGILIGVVIGFVIPFSISTGYALYVSVGLLAAIDSVVGAIRANLYGKFDTVIFLSGFLLNFLLATVLAYIGDQIGVPMYYAAIFAFGTRLFNNIAIIRRQAIERMRRKS